MVLLGLLVDVLSLLTHLIELEIGLCCALHGLLRLLLRLSLVGQDCSIHNRIQIVIRTVNLPALSGRLLGTTLRPLPRVIVPRLSRLALGLGLCGPLRIVARRNPAVSIRQPLFSHFLHSLVTLVHRQTRVNGARLIHRFFLILLHFFHWILRHFL